MISSRHLSQLNSLVEAEIDHVDATCILVVDSMMPSTVTSSGISALFSGLGSLERTSAIIIWLYPVDTPVESRISLFIDQKSL